MRIGILIHSLLSGYGGAERVAINIARGMLARGHDCFLFHDTPSNMLDIPSYSIPQRIVCCNLSSGNGTNSVTTAKRVILKCRCDVVCIFSYNAYSLFALSATVGTGLPLVWSERSAPWLEENILWNRRERLLCLASADIIHLLFPSYTASLPEKLRSRVRIIPNFFDPQAYSDEPSPRARQNKVVLAVANLQEHIKQLSLLISAFAILHAEFPDWECHICGDGPFYKQYQNLIDAYHLSSCVFLEGIVKDIDKWYAVAQIFCLPSRSEGFPMSLLEAQSHGLPSVGFSNCSGVHELIMHECNGLLVSNMDAPSLAEALARLMRNENLRLQYGSAAREGISVYNRERILDQWEELFTDASNRKGHTVLDKVHANLPQEQYERELYCLVGTRMDAGESNCKSEVSYSLMHYCRSRIRLDALIRRLRKTTFDG